MRDVPTRIPSSRPTATPIAKPAIVVQSVFHAWPAIGPANSKSACTIAVGAGQMSRVDAVKVAVMKAAGTLASSVAASDAFFPFRDGLDAVADAGATAVVQPGGSVRDAEVIAAADERGLTMVFTGKRHFRH